MNVRRLAAFAAVLAITSVTGERAAQAAKPPAEWDGLVLVDSKRLDRVYLLPGADFRSYTKVMLDPTEVAFKKNWLRDYNSRASFNSRLSDADAQRMLQTVQTGFEDIFRKTYSDAGY